MAELRNKSPALARLCFLALALGATGASAVLNLRLVGPFSRPMEKVNNVQLYPGWDQKDVPLKKNIIEEVGRQLKRNLMSPFGRQDAVYWESVYFNVLERAMRQLPLKFDQNIENLPTAKLPHVAWCLELILLGNWRDLRFESNFPYGCCYLDTGSYMLPCYQRNSIVAVSTTRAPANATVAANVTVAANATSTARPAALPAAPASLRPATSHRPTDRPTVRTTAAPATTSSTLKPTAPRPPPKAPTTPKTNSTLAATGKAKPASRRPTRPATTKRPKTTIEQQP